MAQDTLFNILRRQPWWISVLVAVVIFWIAYAIFPPVAPFVALPFAVLAVYIAVVQWRSGTPTDVGPRLAELRAMSWETFSAAITDAYRRKGYTVSQSNGRGYDMKLVRNGEVTLLQCRRWKVNQVGEGPLRELARAIETSEARRGISVAAGEFSGPARAFAANEPIALVSGAGLVELMGVRAKTKAVGKRT
jgi:restriction system protein